MVSHRGKNEERVALTSAGIERIKAPALLRECLLCASTHLRVGDNCHAQVSFRLNTGGTGFFSCKECHKAHEIIPLQTTNNENIEKTEEALARAYVTLGTERIKVSNPLCL